MQKVMQTLFFKNDTSINLLNSWFVGGGGYFQFYLLAISSFFQDTLKITHLRMIISSCEILNNNYDISEAFIRITTNNNLTIVLQNIDNKSLYLTDMFGLFVMFMFIHKSDVATWRTASVWCRKTQREPAKEQIQNNLSLYVAGKRFFCKINLTFKRLQNKMSYKQSFFKVIGDWNNTKLILILFAPHL